MKNNDSALVSVIIPAYNAEKFIAKTLDSVRKQTYQNIEIIVIDDGSIDQSIAIVKQFIQEDKRIKLWRQKNLGVAAARNKGIEIAQGEFIAPLDADDLWYPQNLEKQVRLIQKQDSEVALVYCWSLHIDENDFLTGKFNASDIEGNIYHTLVCSNFLGNASCCLMRREVIQEVGGYSLEFKQLNTQGCEDWDLYLKIAAHYQFRVVRNFLVGYRQLKSSMSRDYKTMERSHLLLLDNIRNSYPQLPEFLYRFSLTNLYIYFADQNHFLNCYHFLGDYKKTLFWIKQAIKTQFLLTLFHPGLYLLAIYSYWKILSEQSSSKKAQLVQHRDNNQILSSTDDQKKITLKMRRRLVISLFISNILHRFIVLMS